VAERKLEERAWKAAKHQAKKAEKEAEKTRILAEQMATQGHSHGQGGVVSPITPPIAQESDISGSEEVSDSDPALIDYDDIPTLETGAITQQNLCRPCECRKQAPRFLPEDDEEEDEAPPIVCPQPRPCQCTASLVAPPQVDTSNQLPDDAAPISQSPQGPKATTRAETILVETTEQVIAGPAPVVAPPKPIPHLAPKEQSTVTQDETVQPKSAEAGPSRSVLDSESSIEPGESGNVDGKGLLTRCSTRLAIKRK